MVNPIQGQIFAGVVTQEEPKNRKKHKKNKTEPITQAAQVAQKNRNLASATEQAEKKIIPIDFAALTIERDQLISQSEKLEADNAAKEEMIANLKKEILTLRDSVKQLNEETVEKTEENKELSLSVEYIAKTDGQERQELMQKVAELSALVAAKQLRVAELEENLKNSNSKLVENLLKADDAIREVFNFNEKLDDSCDNLDKHVAQILETLVEDKISSSEEELQQQYDSIEVSVNAIKGNKKTIEDAYESLNPIIKDQFATFDQLINGTNDLNLNFIYLNKKATWTLKCLAEPRRIRTFNLKVQNLLNRCLERQEKLSNLCFDEYKNITDELYTDLLKEFEECKRQADEFLANEKIRLLNDDLGQIADAPIQSPDEFLKKFHTKNDEKKVEMIKEINILNGYEKEAYLKLRNIIAKTWNNTINALKEIERLVDYIKIQGSLVCPSETIVSNIRDMEKEDRKVLGELETKTISSRYVENDYRKALKSSEIKFRKIQEQIFKLDERYKLYMPEVEKKILEFSRLLKSLSSTEVQALLPEIRTLYAINVHTTEESIKDSLNALLKLNLDNLNSLKLSVSNNMTIIRNQLKIAARQICKYEDAIANQGKPARSLLGFGNTCAVSTKYQDECEQFLSKISNPNPA